MQGQFLLSFHSIKVFFAILDLSCVVEVDHFGQFVRKAKTRTCKASTDPVWDQVSGRNYLNGLTPYKCHSQDLISF